MKIKLKQNKTKVYLLVSVIVIIIIILCFSFVNISFAKNTEELSIVQGEMEKENVKELLKASEQDIEWTDFSNATFELKKDDLNNVKIYIYGVTPIKDRYYTLFISNNSNRPNDNFNSDEGLVIYYEEKEEALATANYINNYIECYDEIFVSVIEKGYFNLNYITNVDIFGKKIEKFTEPKYTDGFRATFMDYSTVQIITNFTHDRENDRKMQIKIGKITNNNILNKIKNEEKNGFEDLLSYAKENKGIYNNVVSSNSYKDIGYSTYDGGAPINLFGSIENNCYYYLYVKTDDENGKYISNEAVTFAKASVLESVEEWNLSFYGNNDFEWLNFENDINKEEQSKDDKKIEDSTTIPNTTLPRTGKFALCGVFLSIIIVMSVFLYKRIKWYKNI